MHSHKIYLITSVSAAILSLFTLSFIYFLTRGVPIHDFRLWRFERNFQAAASYHPPESILLQKKMYLGGPYTHGSGTCDFFVGELRSSPFPKEKIRQAYDGHSIKSGQIPLKVLFFDEERWTMDSPLGDWWDEWYRNIPAAADQTVYFVFASQEGYPYLGDHRCDD